MDISTKVWIKSTLDTIHYSFHGGYKPTEGLTYRYLVGGLEHFIFFLILGTIIPFG
jgi:hypothetical protein